MTSPFFKQKIDCRQKMGASLVMRQALEVLQMPIEELTIRINQIITENPLLEWDEKAPSDSFQNKKNHYVHSLDHIPYRPSLFSHLMDQARLVIKDKKLLEITEWIVGNLDPTGFFTLPFSQVPFACEEKEWTFCLEQIRQFDPPGVGAKDLQESLLLQLGILGKENSLSFQIITHDLDLLLAKKFSSLQKKYHLKENTLQKILFEDIACLDPFPGTHFDVSPLAPLPIDIIFIPEESSYPIEVIEPKLPILSSFSLDSLTLEEKTFCKAYQIQAHQVISAIKKRSHTLQKIAKYLVKKQKDYLEGASEILIPLSIQMISKELLLHESTITRALANKNLSSPRGVIPLKSLLSKGLSEEVSCDKAKKLLKKLIAEENKQAPLSDRELLEKLKQLGVPCARRTLTKYRQTLKIPSKKMRKIYF
ncbi:MAG: RNA polymerase factor sigma-54 [Chlamydiota bacterium]